MKTKQAAIIPAPQQTALTKALSLKGEIVAYHKAATAAAEEAMENLFQCGRLLEEVKAVLKADKTTTFGKWVEQFCGFSEPSAHSYCRLHNGLRDLTKTQRAKVFQEHQSQRAVAAFLTDQRKSADPDPSPAKSTPTSPPPASQSVPVQTFADDGETLDGSGGGREIDHDDPLDFPDGPEPDLSTPDTWTDSKPTPSGKPKPPVKALEGREAEAFDARSRVTGMFKTIAQWFVPIDEIRNSFPGKVGDRVQKQMDAVYQSLQEWEKGIK